MKLELNLEKQFFFTLFNRFTLTEESPSVEIDPNILTTNEINSLMFNLRKGVLKGDLSLLTPIPVKKIEQRREPIVDNSLSNLLTRPLNFIKKTLPILSLKEIKILIEIERKGKTRESVLALCEQILQKHQESVTNKITEDVLAAAQFNKTDFFNGMPLVNLDNIGDVLESEETKVTIPLDKEH